MPPPLPHDRFLLFKKGYRRTTVSDLIETLERHQSPTGPVRQATFILAPAPLYARVARKLLSWTYEAIETVFWALAACLLLAVAILFIGFLVVALFPLARDVFGAWRSHIMIPY